MYAYVDTTERVGDLIVQVVADEDAGYANPRDNDNLAHIYGSHRNYIVADGEPPSDENRALERGGIRLLYRWLRRYAGVVAFTKLGMYDHSGVSYYAVPLGENGHHPLDEAGWDSGVTGYAYVTHADCERTGIDETDAERVMLAEIAEYGSWAAGDVWGYVVTRPCDHADEHPNDEAVAACPHSAHVDSCWGFIGEREYALAEGKSAAEYRNAHPDMED